MSKKKSTLLTDTQLDKIVVASLVGLVQEGDLKKEFEDILKINLKSFLLGKMPDEEATMFASKLARAVTEEF
jgi:hypothetical protein